MGWTGVFFTVFFTFLVFPSLKKGKQLYFFLLGEAKDLAPGASLQELNIRKPVTDTISIDTVGGVLNVNKDVFDSDRISFEDLLADVATLIANKIEYNIYDTIVTSAKVPKYNTTQTEDTMEAFGQFVIKAQEAFKGSSGAGADLTIMVESYRTLSYIKQLAYVSNKSVQPIEEIQAYYGVDNIDFLGTTLYCIRYQKRSINSIVFQIIRNNSSADYK